MPIPDSEVTQGRASDEAAYTPPPSLSRSASDWATSFIRGLSKGTIGLAGLPGDVAQAVLEKGHELGVPRPPEGGVRAFPRGSPFATSEEIVEKVGDKGRNATGKFLEGKPETLGGKYAQSVGEFVPGMVGGPSGVVRKGIQAVAGGIGSEAAGQVAQSIAPNHETAARVLGSIGGQSVPGIVKKAITPFPITQERKALVDTLRKEGVEPTAGDVSGSKTLKYAEHALGDAPGAGGKYHAAREDISDKYTRAALKRIGEDADRATPEVMERAATRIGKKFDDLSARNSAKPDMQYASELLKAQQDYDHLFVDPLKKPIVSKVVENAINHIQKGTMDGETYQAQRSMLERMRRGYKSDPEVSGFLAEVRDALDGVMERSIAKNNLSDLGAWKEVRNQYRNMLTLERVAAKGGAAEGSISPAALRQAAVTTGGRKAYAQGKGDFGDLARAGDAILKPPPTSGTAERAFLHAVPAAVGAGLAGTMSGAPEALPAALAGLAAPGVVGRGIMSRPAQEYLKNQLAARLGVSPPMLDKIVRAALAQHSRQSTEISPITVNPE